MTPLPGWKVIPDNWAAAHQPTAEATLVSPCEVRRAAGPPPYPKPAGWVPDTLVWATHCRVQELNRENMQAPGMQIVEERQYRVSMSLTDENGAPAPVLRTGETGDVLHAVGRQFILKQSMAGSLLWEQDFIAVENQTQLNP